MSLKKRLTGWFKRHPKVRVALDHIIHPENSPKATALSIATGIFIGIFIPMGLQLATTLLISPIKKINPVLTSLATLISNPFTVLPIYWLGIITGEYVSGHSFPWHAYESFMNNPGFQSFLAIGAEGLRLLMLGLLIMALPATVIAYFVALRLAVILRKRKGNAHLSQGK